MVDARKIKELGSYALAREWTENEMKKFIAAKVKEAKENVSKYDTQRALQGFGDETHMIKAREEFGEAIHPIMDNYSPEHRDFQVYDTSGWRLSVQGVITAGIDLYLHGKGEERDPTPGEMKGMAEEIQKLYLEVFGANRYKEAVTDPKKQQ